MSEASNSSFTLTTDSDLAKVIEIRLASDEFEAMVGKEVGRYAKRVRIKGFRPGKTPPEMVISQYGGEIREKAREDLLNQVLRRALKERKLSPDGPVQSKEKEPPSNKHAGVYELSFETLPEFDTNAIKGIACSLIKAKVDQADIDGALADLQKRYTEWQDSDQPAADGHQVSFEYTMKVDGEEISAGGEEKMRMDLVLGEKHVIEDLPNQLQGLRAGDSKRIETRFPETFPGAKFAGKAAEFDVRVEAVRRAIVPEINDEFARKTDTGCQTREDLVAMATSYLGNEAERLARNINRSRVTEALLEHFQMPLPQGLVGLNTQRFLSKQEKEREGGYHPQAKISPEDAEKGIRREMILSIIFSSLAREHRFEPPRERIEALIYADAQVTKNPRASFRRLSKSAKDRQRYENIVIEDMIFDHIIKAFDSQFQDLGLRALREGGTSPPAPPPSQSPPQPPPTEPQQSLQPPQPSQTP